MIKMFFEILTLFPSMFEGVFSESIIKRALDNGLVSINIVDFRKFATDKHKTVDDYPYGGDPGMLIKPKPMADAINESRRNMETMSPLVVFMSPHGETLTHEKVRLLSCSRSIIIVCGHYKGIDQRIVDRYADMEISIGDYVLSGGELPAMVLVDAVSRLIPGVLGNSESAEKDSFFNGLLSPPQYTRPEIYENARVPEVLLSGHHENIRKWRMEQAIAVTKSKRPDLWEKYCREHSLPL
jgi:tRNA (guanine37-N1)-methyltransferase